MTQREIASLLQRFVDGRLDEESCEEVVCLLKNDPDIFEIYCEYAELDAGLAHLNSGIATPSQLGTSEARDISERARKHQSRRIRNISLLTSVAAILILLLTLSVIWLKPTDTPPATFTTGPDTIFTFSHPDDGSKQRPEGSLSLGSSLILTEGTLELKLETGVRAILEGPANITLLDKNRLQMSEGIIWCDVASQAVGFQILTPSLKVTDLGTKFGIISIPETSDEIHVFEGQVQVSPLDSNGPPLHLVANEAVRHLPDQSFSRQVSRPNEFLSSLPKKRGHFHWRFDEGDADRQSVSGRMPETPAINSRCTTHDKEEPFASFSVVDGRFGNALSSFGRNGIVKTDWLGIPDGAPFTLSYWVKMIPGQHAPYSLVSWGSDAPDNPSFFSSEVRKTIRGSVTALTINQQDFEGQSPIDDGEWHHITLRTRNSQQGTPPIECFFDGRPELLHPAVKVKDLLSPAKQGHDESNHHLTLFEHPRIRALTGEKINLSLIRENGITSSFLNGQKIGVSHQSPPPFDALTHLTVGANFDNSGQLEGFFTGSIDHLRLATFTGSLVSRELLGGERATINVIADYRFDDNLPNPAFQEIGDPIYRDGKLQLDGNDALVLTPSPLTATDNFIMEVTCTMTEYPTNPRRFAFPVSNGNGMNNGWGIIYHHTWGGMLMGYGPVGSATTDERRIPIEMDELHIFSESLRDHEIKNLSQHNQTNRPTKNLGSNN